MGAVPPLRCRLRFWVFEARLPYEYRWWARQALFGRRAYLRFGLRNLAYLCLGMVPLLVLNFVPIPPLYRIVQRRMLRKHEFLPDGTPFEVAYVRPAGV
jgi:hypothetical protein